MLAGKVMGTARALGHAWSKGMIIVADPSVRRR
jgi:hypothetical protein